MLTNVKDNYEPQKFKFKVQLQKLIQSAITAYKYRLISSVIQAPCTCATLASWTISLNRTLFYTLGLVHGYLGHRGITSASICSTSNHVSNKAEISSRILVLTRDDLFMLHSRQFFLTSLVIDIDGACMTARVSCIKPLEVVNYFLMCNILPDKQVKRCALVALVRALCSLQVVTATLTDFTVSIYAFDFILDATVSVEWRLAAQISWTVDNFCWLRIANWHHFDRVQMRHTGAVLRVLLSAIILSANSYVLSKLTADGGEFHSFSGGLVHIRRFKNHIFLSSWPKQSLNRTWNVEIAVSVGFMNGSDLDATITQISEMAPAPNLLQSVRGQTTMLDILSAAIEHASSSIMSYVYIWLTSLLDRPIIILRKDDVVARISHSGFMLRVCRPPHNMRL